MNRPYAKVALLYQQARYDLAEQELRHLLVNAPDDALAHAWLSLCLSQQKRYQEAKQEAEMAIHLSPDMAFAHYALAGVLDDQDRFAEAESAIAEAIRLDPDNADFRALLASIYAQQRQWAKALAVANAGLQLDPHHVHCANLRAMALVKLGRREEAGYTMDTVLAREPENAVSHANRGWALLEQGERQRAMEHFREALRLNPQLEWAREGIVEALRARHFIYRLILRYFFWMSRLSGRAQWGVIIGLFVGMRLVRGVAQTNPVLNPFLTPLLFLYLAFVYLSWSAKPLFNLLLRLDRFGRLALSEEQITASNWVGGCLLAALAAVGVGVVTGSPIAFSTAIGCAAMVIPVSATLQAKPGRGRKFLAIFTLILAVSGLLSLGLGLAGLPAAAMFSGIFVLGFFVFSFTANFVMSRQ
jgi:tetratricopeptide (TPR) repeat protein